MVRTHKNTFNALGNLGIIPKKMEDYTGALDYYHQALRVQEKVLGKTHPDTLRTITNMANTYMGGLKDFKKPEEMYRLALDGKEKSLGKDHKDTKLCVENLALFLGVKVGSKDRTQQLVLSYPHILNGDECYYGWY